MKVLYLTTHLNTGGITSYLYTIAKGISARGNEAHVFSSGGNKETSFAEEGIKVNHVDILTKSELSPKIYKPLSRISKYIRRNEIDIVHSQTRITQVMGVLLHRITGISCASTCHGFFKPRLSRKIFPCWGQGVIAISEPVRDHLINDLGVDRQRVSLVPSGIDVGDYPLRTDARRRIIRDRYSLGHGPLIGIVARLSDVKGQDILIRSMKEILRQFPEAKLFISGKGKTEGKLKRLTDDLGLNNNVIFHESDNDVVDCLSGLDLFVMSSRQEGLGLSIMEAQAVGLPVIASNIGGIPHLIKDGETGFLFETGNINDLANKVIVALRDTEMAVQIGLKAREFIQKECSSETMVQKTLKFYEGIKKINDE